MAQKLTNKQAMFVKEYLVDLNATQAAIRAGYSEHTAKDIACQNLAKLNIQEAIQVEMDKRSARVEITSDDVLRELAKIGFGNIKNLYDADGQLMHVQDMDERVTATIQEVTEDSIFKSDEEGFVTRRKFKIADKKSSLELIGRHLKMFTDKVETETTMHFHFDELDKDA